MSVATAPRGRPREVSWLAAALLLAAGCTGTIKAGPSQQEGGGGASAGGGGATAAGAAGGPAAGGGGAGGGAGGSGGQGGAAVCGPRAAQLRRLTRSQYAASVQAAFGDKVSIEAGLLPVDEVVLGYASNQTVTPTSQTVQAYQAAAEAVAAQAAAQVVAQPGCDPASKGDEACAQAVLDQVGPSLLRRPVEPDDRARWLKGFAKGSAGGYEAGLRAALSRLLQSPSFVYAIESLDNAGSGAVALTDQALASRLSLLLWNGPPDAALLGAAKQGSLRQDAGLRQQAERMLDDDRASRFVRQFALEWLGINGIDQGSIDPQRLLPFTPAVLGEMKAGASRFVDEVLRRQQGSLLTLLTAGYSYPSGSEAQIYGAGAPGKDGATSWPAGQRSGLLTLPAVLYRTAHSTQTSPVLRGKWVREVFFCMTPPNPPPSVMAIEPKVTEGSSTRDRYAEHSANPTCAGCHDLMDPIGLTFEHYDPLGRYRALDGGKPVDSSGELTQSDVDGALTGVADLATKLSASGQVQACFAKQLFRYAEGRPEGAQDECVLGQMRQALAGPSPLRAAMLAYVMSPGFRTRSVP